MTNDREKSDRLVVPTKPPNNAAEPVAEVVEGSERTKGNPPDGHDDRTQRRMQSSDGIERVRQAARRNRKQRFTALLHHVYNIDRLRTAYFALKRDAAAGIDGETWRHYGEALEANLHDLAARIQRGAFRASPVRRAYIPKADGRQRPLGVPTLEDKIVQRAVVEVLNAIYESDFLGFSYGFRPGRSPHRALDALAVGIETRRVNWVLDADIRGFFDTLQHEWLVRFLEHRVADQRVVRLIQRWRRTHARGDIVVVRFADDFVVGFEHRKEAERFLADLRERFARFGLTLHPDKTRLIEFGRYADRHRRGRGDGKPETFNFLGFTHSCGKTRKGGFAVWRQTVRQRWQAKLREVRLGLRRRLHTPIPEQGAYLRSVLLGHARYYGVPRNGPSLMAFRSALGRVWYATLRRRSQAARVTWARLARLTERWLPIPRICHPYPNQRLASLTQGRSRMR